MPAKRSASAPPRLPLFRWRPLQRGETDHETIWLSVSATGAALAGVWFHFRLPWPRCLFKTLTGCPCLTCGATRGALQAVQGNLIAAFAWNPLTTALLAGWLIYDLYAASVLLTRGPRLRAGAWPLKFRQTARYTAITLLAANWAYVIWRGN